MEGQPFGNWRYSSFSSWGRFLLLLLKLLLRLTCPYHALSGGQEPHDAGGDEEEGQVGLVAKVLGTAKKEGVAKDLQELL